MAERQSHGFKFEVKWCRSNNVILWKEYEAKYGKQYNGGYTSKWDAIDENKVGKSYKGRPIQIKCIGINNAIELGDIFRNSTKEEDFRLIVGFWNGIKTNIHQIVELEINHKKWNKLFKWDRYDELKDWITNKVSNEYSYDNQWKNEMSYYKQLWGSRVITPTFKRDHKRQRRIQCQIPYNTFMEEFVKNKICE